jgi:gluconolactonase
MKTRSAVRTAFAGDFHTVFPSNAKLSPMPSGWDIGGGETAGWGRGLTGLIWVAEQGGVVFSDTAHHRRLFWAPGRDPELVAPTDGAFTGATTDGDGRIVSCDWAGRRVVIERQGAAAEVIAERFDGKALNRPHDICRGPGRSLFLADQKVPYPLPADPGATAPASGVYRLDADGGAENMGLSIALPGGVCFDQARTRLLVTEPRAGKIHALPLTADGRPAGPATVLATLVGEAKGAPHGLTVDSEGRIFVGGPGGVWVLSPDGAALGILHLTSSRVTSLAIGGGKLFIATPTGVGAADLGPGVREAAAAPAAPAILRQPLGFRQAIERHDPALDRIIPLDAVITNHGSGGFFEDLGGGEHELFSRSLEGLFWDSGEQTLKFSDIGNSRRLRLCVETGAISVAEQPTGHTNGATYDHDGNVLSCEQAERRVSRLLPNGERVTVVDRTADGRRLNRPNDIVMRSDGNIYFTDPWWDFGAGETRDADDGLVGAFQPGQAKTRRLRPDGVLETFGGDWLACNGLALSVDETVLFVNDTIRKHIRAFDLAPDGTVDSASSRVFCELPGDDDGKPDGMKLDSAGNIYCGGPGGLWVIDPSGKHLGTIRHGACQTNNVCFGADGWLTLFMCSWVTLHSIPVLIPGVRTLDVRR